MNGYPCVGVTSDHCRKIILFSAEAGLILTIFSSVLATFKPASKVHLVSFFKWNKVVENKFWFTVCKYTVFHFGA